MRTIGVITKSDLAPNDDDLCQQLLMDKKEVLQLKLGFIAVRNRTANEDITLTDARRREKQFFQGHIASSMVGMHSLGIDALINRLADLYADRVQKTFPQMRNEVQNKLDEVRLQLSKFPAVLDTTAARLGKYHETVDYFVENVLKVRLSMGDEFSSLVNVFHRKFAILQKILQKQTTSLYTSAYFDKISNAMSACAGEQLPNFLPHSLLKRFIAEKIDELWHTTKALINDCFCTTSDFILCEDTQRGHEENVFLKKLLPAFANIIELHLNEQRQNALDQLQALIKIEKNDPYTMNQLYMDRIAKIKVDRDTNEEATNDDQSVHDMIASVQSYWDVIRTRFLDYATLSMRDRFVFSVCNGVRDRLRQVPLQQCDFVDGYLAEDALFRAQRSKLQQTHDQLQKCLDILGGRKLTDSKSPGVSTMKNELDAIMEMLDGNDDERYRENFFKFYKMRTSE